MRGSEKSCAGRRPKATACLCALLMLSTISFAQRTGAHGPLGREYPKEIRGYKVELAKVEVKKEGQKKQAQGAAAPGAPAGDAEEDEVSLIRLGEPRVVGLTPLGVTLEVPVTVAPVKQGGRVDFLTFEDMTVNGTPVTVNEYNKPFDLPNDAPLTLKEPVSIYISTPRAVLGVLGEWNKPADLWPVTGRVYVFGHFKKFIFTFKRVVPVELNMSFRNPLRKK